MASPGSPTTAELIDGLRRPAAYPRRPMDVDLVQTHISLVFLADDRVYKVKKAVDLGFLDYTTLDRRRLFCEEEVRLNRRLAPGVYLGVVPITRERDGSLRVSGNGPTVEYAVEMRRLPASRMLDHLFATGEIDNERVETLAELLAGFHGAAATGAAIDEYGTPEAIAFNVRENFEQTAAFAARPGSLAQAGARTLSPGLHAFLREAAGSFLAAERDLFEQRVAEGRIRDGHGDLHAGNICLTADGFVVYDCIEFASRFRCGDVACDLAFLAMDLDYRGFRAFSRFLVRCYARHAGDTELGRLMGFYKSYRAVVRAKVASLAAAEPELPLQEREAKRLEGLRYFNLAAAYELPPGLILTCGLPASGKSTVARHLALPFEALVLRSDTRRKLLAGLPLREHGRTDYLSGIYTAEMSERTYRALLDEAKSALDRDRTVVVDASFSRAAQRRPFIDLARVHGAPVLIVETVAPEKDIRARMSGRDADAKEVSDANLGIYLRMKQTFERPSGHYEAPVIEAAPGEPGEETTARAIDALVCQIR